MSKKGCYTLDTIGNLEIETSQITVEDSSTGEEKVVKTVNRADVVCVVAYMLGIPKERLDEYYSHHHGRLLEQLRNNQDATTIRYLSKIRTAILNHFLDVDNAIVYELKNLDRQSFFDKKEIDKLFQWGVYVIQPNYRSEKYVWHLTKLIDEHIDKCKALFPDSVKYGYIRELFVVNKYDKKNTLIAEYEKFKGNKNLYPFQMYMNWKPADCGNILYNDSKFLNIVYAQHGETFYESYKYHDASEDTKKSISDFIHEANQVVMVVDCENADPYKLYGVLKNLNRDELSCISKIILYDDYHTTIAWDYIKTLISVPVEHIEVDRIMDSKSLVDIKMAVGVTIEHCKKGVDSFVLCSSDSDFWGLISSIPEAKFLVMYEYSKCGEAIKQALTSRNIFHCAMDDFYMANSGQLQKIVLKKVLESYLPNIVGENGWEITRQIYADAFIQATDSDMKSFYDKYIRHIRLKIGADGRFYVTVDE